MQAEIFQVSTCDTHAQPTLFPQHSSLILLSLYVIHANASPSPLPFAGWVANLKIRHSLSTAFEIQEAFNRDDEVDADERRKFITNMELVQRYKENEISILAKVISNFTKLSHLKPLASPDPLVTMEVGWIEGDANNIGKAETVIDASLEEATALFYMIGTRRDVNDFYNNRGGIERNITHHNHHSHSYTNVVDTGVPGMKRRVFELNAIWKYNNEERSSLTIVYGTTNSKPKPAANGDIIGTGYTRVMFERLKDFQGIPQTKVTYYTQINIGGVVPYFIMNKKMGGRLKAVSDMRMIFDKSLEIDSVSRRTIVGMIDHGDSEPYTDSEVADIANGRRDIEIFNALPNKKAIKAGKSLSIKHDRDRQSSICQSVPILDPALN